jgi:hypothetical protein
VGYARWFVTTILQLLTLALPTLTGAKCCPDAAWPLGALGPLVPVTAWTVLMAHEWPPSLCGSVVWLCEDGAVDFDLTRLGDREFEHLSQALAPAGARPRAQRLR